jgi:hypothetical protein
LGLCTCCSLFLGSFSFFFSLLPGPTHASESILYVPHQGCFQHCLPLHSPIISHIRLLCSTCHNYAIKLGNLLFNVCLSRARAGFSVCFFNYPPHVHSTRCLLNKWANSSTSTSAAFILLIQWLSGDCRTSKNSKLVNLNPRGFCLLFDSKPICLWSKIIWLFLETLFTPFKSGLSFKVNTG